jgi:hypothetical protein
MTKEEIIQLANKVGIKGPAPARQGFKMFASPYRLQQFAAIVAAAEREACAKVCEQAGIDGMGTLAAAAMIRKRDEK